MRGAERDHLRFLEEVRAFLRAGNPAPRPRG